MPRPRNEILLPWDAGSDPSFLRDREWLLTNGLGGYASGSLAGILTRKYHGLFVPNLAQPKGRHVMISRCDELVVRGALHTHLGGAEFSEQRFTGESHHYLQRFRLRDGTAIWEFDLDGAVLEKSITLAHNQNLVCVRYRLLRGDGLELQVRPFMSFRRADATPEKSMTERFTTSICRGRHEVTLDDSTLVLRMGLRPVATGSNAVFIAEDREELDFFYRVENARGDPSFESAFSPGYFRARLEPGEPLAFLATTQSWESFDVDVEQLFTAQKHRMAALLDLTPQMEGDEFAQQLVMAADQFIILPGSRREENLIAEVAGSELRTVIAGYHWFGDWGRDTMISLEGLTLCTGRYREAGAILRTFSQYVKDGLLPNLFPEGERQALYHTVDATLWYFHAIDRYVETTADDQILEQLFPVLASIVDHYLRGTHYGIKVDPRDGLVSAAAEGYQLTWMDAKVDGWVVTPRRGKPVEIQALWYNALMLMASWSERLQQPPEHYRQHARLARESFNQQYWNEQTGCLFDVLDGPEGPEASIRPNQVFAISLRHPVLDEQHWSAVLEVVGRKLMTPYGLRTLSSEHPDYKSHYRGDLRARDAAYHQGTVWPWLMGHYIDAYLRVREDRAHARQLLQGFREHLHDAGVGSISEIFDAEEPFAPGGCIAQAWSVAEILRAWLKTRA